jgi:hypothetical protein
MPRARLILALAATLMLAVACGDDTEGAATTGPDLVIERRTGYAVQVDQSSGRLLIAFNADRSAVAGETYDLSDALWRTEDGLWTEPPATCITPNAGLEIGVAEVQNIGRPGFLDERVIWVGCLSPTSG